MSDLMNTQEVADLIRRPIETMRYWRWKGLGPRSFKIGRAVVYERADVEAWLQEQKAATASTQDAA